MQFSLAYTEWSENGYPVLFFG